MTQEEQKVADSDGQTGHSGNNQRSIAEWTTLAISVTILLTIIGLIGWLHFMGGGRPAAIVVEPQADQFRQEASGYYLPVVIRNEGDTTVQDVQIQGELDTGSGEPETAEFVIPFLVGGEEVDGTFIFQSDPSQGELTTVAGSYKLP